MSRLLTLDPADVKVRGVLRFYLPPASRKAKQVAVYRLKDGAWENMDGSGWDKGRDMVQAHVSLLGAYVALNQGRGKEREQPARARRRKSGMTVASSRCGIVISGA